MAKRQPQPPHLTYQALMTNVRARFDVIEGLNLDENSGFATYETAAFHLRKSIEAIAFGCLVAVDKAFREVPRDARGHWNADNIFINLKKRNKLAFPEAFLRQDPPAAGPAVQHHIVGRPEVNLTVDDVRAVYRRTHKWLHEWNPYVEQLGKDYDKSRSELRVDIPSVWNWISQHMIGIGGHVFLGLLKDPNDGQVRIVTAESVNP